MTEIQSFANDEFAAPTGLTGLDNHPVNTVGKA
jgi:hypothetical protein